MATSPGKASTVRGTGYRNVKPIDLQQVQKALAAGEKVMH
jgi:hypothetical protein